MLTLDAATTIAQVALTFAAEHRLAPRTVVVLGPGGRRRSSTKRSKSIFS